MFALALSMTLAVTVPPSMHLLDETVVSAGGILLAQQTPPPLPVYPGAPGNQNGYAAQRDIEREIDSINSQLRNLSGNWPTGSILLVVFGSILAPAVFIGLLTIVFPFIGIPFLLVGLGGIAMIVGGIVGGSAAANEAKEQKEQLIQRRESLERDLRDLRRQGSFPGSPSPVMLTLATF